MDRRGLGSPMAWRPSILQLVAIAAATVGGHIATLVVDRFMVEGWPLWVDLGLMGLCTAIAYGATVLHNRRVTLRKAQDAHEQLPATLSDHSSYKAIWIDRKRAFRLLRHSSLVRSQLGRPVTDLHLHLREQLGPIVARTPEDQKVDDLTQGLYLEFENQHPEAVSADGCDERTLRLWIARKIREQKSEPGTRRS